MNVFSTFFQPFFVEYDAACGRSGLALDEKRNASSASTNKSMGSQKLNKK